MKSRIDRRKFVAGSAALALGAGLPTRAVRAQSDNWPDKPVRIIVGLAAGGLVDVVTRATADHLSRKFNQPFIVENRVGASGTIAGAEVAKAKPDGYTVLASVMATVVHSRATFSKLPFDPVADLAPLALFDTGPVVMVIHGKIPANNMQEFVAWSKTNKASFGMAALGSTAHMLIAQLNKQYGLDVQPIGYRGESALLPDLVSGALTSAITSYMAVKALPAGSVRILALQSTRRNRNLPDVPTFTEQGFVHKVFEHAGYMGMWAPAKMPAAIREKFSAAVVEASNTERMMKIRDQFGIDNPTLDWRGAETALDAITPPFLSILRELNVKVD